MKFFRTVVQSVAAFLLFLSRKLVPEDLSGSRVLKVRIQRASENEFRIHLTDVKTGQWVEQFESYPSNPLLQADNPQGMLKDFLLHTGGEGRRSNYALHERNWKYGFPALEMVPKVQEAYYHAVVAFLRSSKSQIGDESLVIDEFPAGHMFCREIAATWWTPEFGDVDKGLPYYVVQFFLRDLWR